MLGLTRGTVRLEPHDEYWHQLFADEKTLLLAAIGDRAVPIEHIGSTSICGISAKPILDIMIGIKPFEPEFAFVTSLERLGYEYKGENGVPERHFFGKGVPRTIHLNVVEHGGAFWLSHIAFREHVRKNADSAREYDRLKRHLASRFPSDRESYTKGKEAFVNKVISATLNK